MFGLHHLSFTPIKNLQIHSVCHISKIYFGSLVKNLPAIQEPYQTRHEFHFCVTKISLRRAWQPTSVFLPGNSQGQRRLVGLQIIGWQWVGDNWATNQQQSYIPDRSSEDTRDAWENSQPRQSERKCLDRAELLELNYLKK